MVETYNSNVLLRPFCNVLTQEYDDTQRLPPHSLQLGSKKPIQLGQGSSHGRWALWPKHPWSLLCFSLSEHS